MKEEDEEAVNETEKEESNGWYRDEEDVGPWV